jgi:hypothetical protein
MNVREKFVERPSVEWSTSDPKSGKWTPVRGGDNQEI